MLENYTDLRTKQALKIGFGCMLCMLINGIGHLPSSLSFFGAVSVFVVFSLFPTQAISKALERALGPMFFVAIALILVKLLIGTPLLYWIAALILLYIAISHHHHKHGYAYLFGGIVAAIIFIEGAIAPNSTMPIAIGITIQLIVSVIVIIALDTAFPTFTKLNFDKAFTQLLNQLSHLCQDLNQASTNYEDVKKINIDELNEFTKFIAKIDNQALQTDQEHLAKTAAIKSQLLLLKRSLNILQNSTLLTRYSQPINSCLNTIAKDLLNLRTHTGTTTPCKKITDLTKKITQDRKAGEFKHFPYRETLNIIAVAAILKKIWSILHDLPMTPMTEEPNNEEQETHSGQARVAAFRVCTVTLLTLLAYHLFHWGNSIQTIIAGCVFSMQVNHGKLMARVKYRLAGIMAGGAAATLLMVLLLLWPHYLIYLSLMLVFLSWFAYLALGNDSIAYFGLQAGIILPLVLIGTDISPTSFNIVLERFEGVFQGLALGITTVILIAPTHPLKTLHTALNKILQQYINAFYALANFTSTDEITKPDPQEFKKLREYFNDSLHLTLNNKIATALESIVTQLSMIAQNLHVMSAIIEADQTDVSKKLMQQLSLTHSSISHCFTCLHQVLAGSSQITEFSQQVKSLKTHTNETLAHIRTKGMTAHFTLDELETMSTLLTCDMETVAALEKLSQTLDGFISAQRYAKLYQTPVEKRS